MVTPRKKPASPAKRNSHGRKKGEVQSLKSTIAKKKSAKSDPTLSVYAPAGEFEVEFYTYTVNDRNDGFTYPFKKYAAGDNEVPSLEEANFVSLKFRKIPGSINEIMKDEKGFWRSVMIRKPGVSSPESRSEGLRVLKAFFMDSATTAFPPKDIATVDQTNILEPHALDTFLQDRDVEEIVTDAFNEEVLDDCFYDTFTELAKLMWSGPPYPDFARKLGFPE